MHAAVANRNLETIRYLLKYNVNKHIVRLGFGHMAVWVWSHDSMGVVTWQYGCGHMAVWVWSHDSMGVVTWQYGCGHMTVRVWSHDSMGVVT